MFIKGNLRKEKPITTSKSFSEKVEEDSTSFLENLIVNIEAND